MMPGWWILVIAPANVLFILLCFKIGDWFYEKGKVIDKKWGL